MIGWLALASYGAAALLYAVAAIVVIAGRPASSRGKLLAAAIAATSVWAGGSVLSLVGAATSPLVLVGLDVFHLFAWTLCLLPLLGKRSVRKWLLIVSAAAGSFAIAVSWSGGRLSMGGLTSYPALEIMALIGLLTVEQVYRNARNEVQQRNKWLYFGVGGIFALDLFVYAHAILLGAPDPVFWAIRGFANAACFR